MSLHKPYELVLQRQHDFEVNYEIILAPFGRQTFPCQGIKWDFWYEHHANDKDELFMIWPEFMDSDRKIILDKDKPISRTGMALMWIVNPNFRQYHQDKIKIGLHAEAREGNVLVAKYVVTKIVGLGSNPS